MKKNLYIGLMSGTSIDAIDAALVDFSQKPLKIIATHSISIPKKIKEEILKICVPGQNEIDQMGEMDIKLGKLFSKAALGVLKKAKVPKEKITAIGSHGQTIRHRPDAKYPFTLQIGNPNIIAEQTGIITVADFRSKDMALGGQGAPLAPIFHEYLFRNKIENRFIINIGGIANISILPKNLKQKVYGFDIGPGNVLLDAWIFKHKKLPFDQKGKWASAGKICQSLLKKLLNDSYFKKHFPKSAGREYFNLVWLQKYLKIFKKLKPQDVQATLTELTAKTIANAVTQTKLRNGVIFLCGGGTRNIYCVKRITELLKKYHVITSDEIGVAPKWIEAAMFAWLAKQTMERKKLNLSRITGSKKPVILGGIYY